MFSVDKYDKEFNQPQPNVQTFLMLYPVSFFPSILKIFVVEMFFSFFMLPKGGSI